MSARLATRLIQVHMCLVYFFAGVSKLKGEAWWNGNAIWMAAANAEYQTGDLTWIAWYPWLGQMITHVTILWEIFFCVLVWNRGWRPIMLMIGTLMHLGIGAFLGMWTFGLVMIFTYISFIPPGLLRSIMRSIMLIVTDPFTRLSSRTPNDVTPSPPRENSSASAAPSASELHRAPSTEVLPPATLRQDLNCTGPDQLPFRNLTEITSFPSSILLVDSTTSRLARVQNFFLTEQLTCLAACDLSDASQQLVSRPFSGVILMADTYEELEEALQLRRLLIQMKQAGPVTVLAMTSAIAEVMLEPAEPDHRFVVEPFTPSDLLEELKAGWKSRGVSFDPTGTQQRKTVNQPATPLTAGQNEETMS